MIWKDGKIELSDLDRTILDGMSVGNDIWCHSSNMGDTRWLFPPVLSPTFFVLLMNPDLKSQGAYWKEYRHLLDCSNNVDNYYEVFSIIKKNKVREISTPSEPLLSYQRWILKNILQAIPLNDAACAYRLGYSLTANALPHIGHKVFIKLDVRNFFASIKYHDIRSIFINALGYPSAAATLLANLCCKGGSLPQGAPTSPCLSNVFMKDFDESISSFCQRRKISYTRYSDDMTFSADSIDHSELIGFVCRELIPKGLRINHDKTRIYGVGARHQATGVVCNEKLNVVSSYRRQIRQEMYYIKKYGVNSHIEKSINLNGAAMTVCHDADKYLAALRGRIAFVLQINPENKEFIKYGTWQTPSEKNFKKFFEFSRTNGKKVSVGYMKGSIRPPRLFLEN